MYQLANHPYSVESATESKKDPEETVTESALMASLNEAKEIYNEDDSSEEIVLMIAGQNGLCIRMIHYHSTMWNDPARNKRSLP